MITVQQDSGLELEQQRIRRADVHDHTLLRAADIGFKNKRKTFLMAICLKWRSRTQRNLAAIANKLQKNEVRQSGELALQTLQHELAVGHRLHILRVASILVDKNLETFHLAKARIMVLQWRERARVRLTARATTATVSSMQQSLDRAKAKRNRDCTQLQKQLDTTLGTIKRIKKLIPSGPPTSNLPTVHWLILLVDRIEKWQHTMAHKEVEDPLVFITSLTDIHGPKLQTALRSCINLCGPAEEGFDLVDLLCAGIARVESVMTDLGQELEWRTDKVHDLGCELTNVGAAVDHIMAVHNQNAKRPIETVASLEQAKANLVDAAGQGKLLEETNNKLATAEKRIQVYRIDRSKILNMF